MIILIIIVSCIEVTMLLYFLLLAGFLISLTTNFLYKIWSLRSTLAGLARVTFLASEAAWQLNASIQEILAVKLLSRARRKKTGFAWHYLNSLILGAFHFISLNVGSTCPCSCQPGHRNSLSPTDKVPILPLYNPLFPNRGQTPILLKISPSLIHPRHHRSEERL